MKHYEKSAWVTLYAGRAVAVLVAAMLPLFPVMVEWYHRLFRALSGAERVAIIAGFYACAAPVLLALWNMDKLLRNILQTLLFTTENVNHIRAIRWCCLAVCLICLCASFGFPSLIFLGTIMGFLCLVVTVVGQVMKAAVVLREENDLTV